MMTATRRMLFSLSVIFVFTGGLRAEDVGNFALIDQDGKFRELDYYLKQDGVKGVVIFIQGNGCPLVRKRVPELNRLSEEYQQKGVLFCMLNANLQDDRKDILEEARLFEIKMPVLKDEAQVVAKSLGVKRTAEVYLLNRQRKIVYRGAVDDRLSYQSEKPKAEKLYLKEALMNFVAGKEITPAVTEAPGCKVTYLVDEENLTYTKDIAPILAKNCVSCHTKGGLGPFSMSSYKKVSGWSDMIAEVVMTQQMPPWHADPTIGEFSNDCGLAPEEAFKIVAWVANGGPRGEGDDPLESFKPELPEWQLGKPDHIMDLPAQKVPAEGVLDYRYITLDNPFDHDVWLTACEVQPGNTRVLHHVIVTSHAPGSKRNRQWITGYAPGTQGQKYPRGSSVFLKKGHQLRFQLHYTVSGRPEEDRTRLGLQISKKPTAKIFKTAVVANRRFKIPAGDAEYGRNFTLPVKKNITLYAINPHMHFRGKSMNFEAHFPDKSKKMLLSVPNYDFNWQRTYLFKNPVKLPAGSKVFIRNAWDNSKNNPHNPDPSKAIGWGEQSFDEMFFATLGYVEDE